MPLCTSGSNYSSNDNHISSSEGKHKRVNSAGSANSSHSGNTANAHIAISKRGNRNNSKSITSTSHIVKDVKSTVVPSPVTKLAENA